MSNQIRRKISLTGYSRVDEELEMPQVLLKLSSNQTDPNDEHFEIIWIYLTRKIHFDLMTKIKLRLHDWGSRLTGSKPTSSLSNSIQLNGHANNGQITTPTINGNGCPNGGLSKLKVLHNSDEKIIFQNINGSVRSGELSAILGPSGAGKTTLLDCLVGRPRPGTTGKLEIRGAKGKRSFKICLIPQKDHLIDTLSVRENLWYASRIKNTRFTNDSDHDENIAKVIQMLQLESCYDVPLANVSGGQHKRVSIAQELLSNPDILVLDEPTSGLDSLTCYKTISVLRDLSQLSKENKIKPMAIILTIHQPQVEVLDMFDRMYVLGSRGKPIYEGVPNNALDVIRSTTNVTIPDVDLHCNVASLLIEIASGHYGLDAQLSMQRDQANKFARHYQQQM